VVFIVVLYKNVPDVEPLWNPKKFEYCFHLVVFLLTDWGFWFF
jgi:hypothetical protein